MAINNIDISANEVANGTRSIVGVQKKPNGTETLENIVPVMETMVRNKTSPFDFLILHT